jgi:transposase
MPKKKQFDKDFKLNAVRLVQEKGLSLRQVSSDLGIGFSTLQRWSMEAKKYGHQNAFPGSGYLKPEDERIRKLEKENEILRRERDILKKAMVIFSSH